MTRITVSINAYNGMPFLIEAVESILKQTMQDFILFIVNDGSTDGTADYLKQLTDPRIRVLDQANSGTAASSNRAISECNTEYIVRMDADDISLPTRLECLLQFMASRQRDVVRVHANYILGKIGRASCRERVLQVV